MGISLSPPASSRPRTTDDDLRANKMVVAFALLEPGDPRHAVLRTRAIEAWLPMSRRLCRRYVGHGENLDDLHQVAAVGLIKAVDRFDAGRTTDFASFAVPTVLGELKRHFRDQTWAIRIPRRLQEQCMAITAARTELTQALHRSPTVAEIALRLNIDEEEVIEAVAGSNAYRTISTSAPVRADQDVTLSDLIGSPDPGFDRVDFTIALPPALTCLTDREKQVIALRFYGNRTQQQIAQQIGVSQMHISRLLAAALEKMRQQLS